MPNYCECDLFVNGEPEELKRFVAGLKVDGEGKFSILRSYFPMPAELEHTISPAMIVEDEAARMEYMKERPSEIAAILASHPITRAESAAYLATYGANNWYDWACNNWGTKWGDFDAKFIEPLDEDGPWIVPITFRTAWHAPHEGMVVVVAQFPELEFSLYWHERGMAIQGGYEYKDGGLVDSWQHEYKGNRGG